MRRVTFRGLAQRKLRALVTTLAVFLGVAFIAGGYVLTDTINASFDDIFDEAYAGTDVSVAPSTRGGSDDVSAPAFPAEFLDRVRKVDGVESAAGGIFSLAQFVDKNGDKLTAGFAPNFVSSVAPPPFESLTYTEGRPPESADEASIDTSTAENEGLGIGDTLRIAGERQVRSYKIVGLQRLGNTENGGAGTAQLTLPEAQSITGKEGEFDAISVAAAPGVSPEVLRRRIDRVLPPQVQVETGQEAAQRQSNDIKDDLSFFRIVLLVFGGVTLFVGSFLIFNIFNITVAQRIRELGLLRTLGATRAQVLASVVGEAAVIGVVGSALGVVGGIGFAKGLNAVFTTFGIDLPNTGTVIAARTIIVALLVGIIVTLVSALSPALRATRVSPMAALREAELPESRRRGRIVTAVAVVLGLGGLGLTALGIFGGAESNTAAVLVGGGAASTLLGVSLFSPRLVRPLASVAGWPLERVRGLTGRLARENTVRKPGRTATTAAALMIGLAVVVFVTVFAAGISESVGKTIDRNFQGDVVLQNTDGFSPIPAGAAREAAKVDGVGTVGSLSYAGAERNGKNIRVAGVDPATANDIFSLDWKNGDPSTLDDLGPRDAVVDDAWAKGQDIDVGDEVKMITPLEKRVSFTVAGSVKDNADLLGNMVITEESLRKDFGTKSPSLTLLTLAPGASADQVQKAVGDAIEARYPTVETLNQEELKDKQEEQINQLVAFFYVLLALAIVISLLGIVTTLVLSIHERTRELGMLRAVGMSRRQVRTMVRYEAVITALIGAVLGMGLGIIFAALMSAPLADEGFVLAYPVPTLVILLLLAALAGVFAAIWPGGRGARPEVIPAPTSE
jgi:putative ABC transport system permease protein